MKRTNEKDMVFGKRLQSLRQRTGRTAIEVARDLGVAPSTYRDWEQGRAITGSPYPELARALQVSLQDLFEEPPPARSEALNKIEQIESLVSELRKMI